MNKPSAFLVALTFSSLAVAQPSSPNTHNQREVKGVHASGTSQRAQADPAPPTGAISMVCCDCIGAQKVVTLYTGFAGWHLTSAPSPLGANSPLSSLVPSDILPYWTASMPPAKWLVPNLPTPAWFGPPIGHYIYELTITVPACSIPGPMSLKGYAAGDDEVTAILVGPNGPVTLAATAPGGYGFQSQKVIGFFPTLQQGVTYILRMDVNNTGSGGTTSPTGLLVNAWIETNCPNNAILTEGPPNNPR